MKRNSRKAKISLTVFVISTIALSAVVYISLQQPDMTWIMVNVNYSKQQADAHFITVKNGKTILIDVGHRTTAKESLLPFLEEKSIQRIDTIFISHPHLDHYGGLDLLLDSDIEIKEVYFNLPDRALCDKEIPWGCDYNDILALHQKIRDHGVILKRAEAGQYYKLGKETQIELLYAFDGINTPVGKTDINDLSLIMMLFHGAHKFLFTGDLNWKIGQYLAKSADNISADILKVPHHGTERVAPNAFFEKVSPKYALVPSPQNLWLGKRSKRIRNWFQEKDIPVYVNGISGNIRVTINDSSLTVMTEEEFETHSSSLLRRLLPRW